MRLPEAAVDGKGRPLELDHRALDPPFLEEIDEGRLAGALLTELLGPPPLGGLALGSEVERVTERVEGAPRLGAAGLAPADGEGLPRRPVGAFGLAYVHAGMLRMWRHQPAPPRGGSGKRSVDAAR